MKNLKFGVLAFGVLGVLSVFLPLFSMMGKSVSLWQGRSDEAGAVYMTIAGFAIAAVAGGLAVAKGPLKRWHAILGTVGFVLVLLKLRSGMGIGLGKLFSEGAIGAKLMIISMFAGLIVSIIAAVKPEEG